MKHLIIFKVNLKKELIQSFRYLPNTISELVIFYIVFLGFFFGIKLVGDPNDINYNIQMVILNYVFWFLVLTATQGIGWEISNEAGQGTLEQLYLTPYKLWFILLTRMISTIIISIFSITILLYAAMFTSKQWLNIDVFSLIPIFILTIIGVVGIGYIVAGVTMILKQISHILQLFQFVIMAATFVPLTVAPYLKLAPFMLGLQMMRDIAISGVSLKDLSSLDIITLLVNSFFYFFIGVLIFKSCENFARKKGLLGHY